MARDYRLKYYARFENIHGYEFRLSIYQDNYSGSSQQVRLGGSPMLTLKKNGRIHALSLSFKLEAETEGQYIELYTSKAFEFKVEVTFVAGATVKIFSGYINIETYSRPEIAPPYDVTITASTGISLAKDTDFNSGTYSYSNILSILSTSSEAFNADNLTTYHFSALKYEKTNDAVSGYLNLRLRSSKDMTCYKMLEQILESLGMQVYNIDNAWWLIRDADLYVNGDGEIISNDRRGVIEVMSIENNYSKESEWPVGKLSSKILPARKSIIVTAPRDYAQAKIAVTASSSTDDYYKIAAGGSMTAQFDIQPLVHYIKKSENIPGAVMGLYGSFRRLVTFKAGIKSSDSKSVNVQVAMVAENYSGTSGTTYYLRKTQRGENIGWGWTTIVGSTPPSFDLEIGYDSESAADALNDCNFIIPLPDYRYADDSVNPGACHITITVTNLNSSEVYVDKNQGVTVEIEKQDEGTKITATMANGAATKADDITCIFPEKVLDGQDQYLKCALLRQDSEYPAWNFVSRRVTDACSLAELIARENAIINSLPRKVLSGVINVGTGGYPIYALTDTDGVNYLVDEFFYDIINAEEDFEATSIPEENITTAPVVTSGDNDSNLETRVNSLEIQMAAIRRLFGLD